MENAIIYARVSADTRAGEKSLQEQVKLCQEYANAHGYIPIATCTDVASGTTMDRPGLTALLEYIESEHSDVKKVIMTELTRLARQDDDMLTILARMQDTNVSFSFTNNYVAEESDRITQHDKAARVGRTKQV